MQSLQPQFKLQGINTGTRVCLVPVPVDVSTVCTLPNLKAGQIALPSSTKFDFGSNLRLQYYLLVQYTATGAMRVFRKSWEQTTHTTGVGAGVGTGTVNRQCAHSKEHTALVRRLYRYRYNGPVHWGRNFVLRSPLEVLRFVAHGGCGAHSECRRIICS